MKGEPWQVAHSNDSNCYIQYLNRLVVHRNAQLNSITALAARKFSNIVDLSAIRCGKSSTLLGNTAPVFPMVFPDRHRIDAVCVLA